MEKILRLFDLFSQTPTLKVNGRKRASTNFGSFVGFLSITILLTGIGFILNDYFKRLSYKVNSYITNSDTPNINLKELKVGFLLTDIMGKEFPDMERIFSFHAKFWDIYIPIDYNKTTIVNFENIPKIKCNEYKNDHKFKLAFDEYTKIYKNLICLDFDSLNKNLTGAYGNFGK